MCPALYFSHTKVKPVCPTCGVVCGTIYGDQPYGTMEVSKIKFNLSGYEKYNTIAINYTFPDGNQGVSFF